MCLCLFQFETVDLEDGLDILEIWDGGPTLATSSYIGYVSGQSAGQYETYISSTNIIIFVLITDSSLAKEGVTISWSTGDVSNEYCLFLFIPIALLNLEHAKEEQMTNIETLNR